MAPGASASVRPPDTPACLRRPLILAGRSAASAGLCEDLFEVVGLSVGMAQARPYTGLGSRPAAPVTISSPVHIFPHRRASVARWTGPGQRRAPPVDCAQVTAVRTAKEALPALENGSFDIVLKNHDPANGVNACRFLRKASGVPVVGAPCLPKPGTQHLLCHATKIVPLCRKCLPAECMRAHHSTHLLLEPLTPPQILSRSYVSVG